MCLTNLTRPSLSLFHSIPFLPLSLSSSSHGRRLRNVRKLRRQGGIGLQSEPLHGSSLPLSRLPHSYSHCYPHRSICQVPSFLSFPLSFSLLCHVQEKLLTGFFNSNTFERGFSISDLPSKYFGISVPSNQHYHLFSVNPNFRFCHVREKLLTGIFNWSTFQHGFPSSDLPSKYFGRSVRSNQHYRLFSVNPNFQFYRKMKSLKVLDQFRSFSSSGLDSDDDNEKISEDTARSSADPIEVDRVAKVIEELFALDRNMEAVLDECGVNLTHDLVIDVLRRFKHARKPAFRFFCWAGQKPGFSHDSRTYNAMISILGKTRQFETMVSLLEEVGEKGFLTIETFSIAIKAFAAGKERKKAVGMFELMKKYKFKAGVETINCLLDALGREKLAKEAQMLYNNLQGRFTPNLQTYSVLLSGWCRAKNLMEAGRVWNEMIDNGVNPDIVTYNIMLDGLLRVNKKSDAIKLFEVMKAKGPAPNARSYTILIRDLCKHRKLEEAIAYLDEMLKSGCDPDAAVYTCLITGFGNEKKMDMVYGLLREMQEKGCTPDSRLYNALIKLMSNRRMPDDAVQIYKKMIRSGVQPTIHTYNMIMKSYFMKGNYEMGRTVWDEMIEKGCCPDDNSYVVLLGGLVRQGRSEEVCKYVEEMIEKGMKVPQLDFCKFSADMLRAGRPNVLEEMARKMEFSGKPEVSHVLMRWAEMVKTRVKRRGPTPIDD